MLHTCNKNDAIVSCNNYDTICCMLMINKHIIIFIILSLAYIIIIARDYSIILIACTCM